MRQIVCSNDSVKSFNDFLKPTFAQTWFFFSCMDELGNIFNLSGDIWRKNERDVKQTSCKVVCFNAVRVAPTVFTGYMCVCVCVCIS